MKEDGLEQPGKSGRGYSCEEAIDRIGMTRTHYLLIALVGLCWAADAMEMLLLSFIGPAIRCEWDLVEVDEANLTMVVFMGMMLGAYSFGIISDKMGRRIGVFLTGVLTFGFGMTCAFAPSFNTLLVLRFGVGVGIGGVPVAFSLLMEYLPSYKRGPIGIIFCTCWSLGAMLEAGLAWLVMTNGLGWRWLIGISSAPLLLVVVLVPLLPESPRYHLTHGNTDKCDQVLQRLAESNGVVLSGSLTPPKPQPKGRLGDLFTRGIRTSTTKQCVLWLLAAFSYYGVVLLTTQLFNMEDEGTRCNYNIDNDGQVDGECEELGDDAYVDVFITSCGELPGLLLTSYLVQKIGRISTVSMWSALMGVLCLLLIPCTSRGVESAIIFMLRASSTSFFQVLYVYTGEFYPASVKATALGAASFCARIGGIVTPYVAQVIANRSVASALSLYSLFAFVCALLSASLPFDTLGKTIPDSIEELRVRVVTIKGFGVSAKHASVRSPRVSRIVAETSSRPVEDPATPLNQGKIASEKYTDT